MSRPRKLIMIPMIALVFWYMIVIDNASAQNCECGLMNVETRVFNGQASQPHKYPWLVYLRIYKYGNHRDYALCGGSLIDKETVMTAAHCVHDEDNKVVKAFNIRAHFGVYNITRLTKGQRISSVYLYSPFDRNDPQNDIALIKLTEPVEFTLKVSPICLSPQEHGLTYDMLSVAGWGMTSATEEPEVLQETMISPIERNRCQQIIYNLIYLYPDLASQPWIADLEKICTMGIHGESICGGDSGTPLMHLDRNSGRIVAAGIASLFIGKCGQLSAYSLNMFTPIAKYSSWIKNVATESCFIDS